MDMEKLNGTIARAKLASERLQGATNQLTDQLNYLEKEVVKLGLFVSAWVWIYRPENHEKGRYVKLVFGRFQNYWRVGIVRGTMIDGETKEENFIPLSNASRRERMDCVGVIPDLIEMMFIEVDRVEQDLREKTETVAGYVEGVRDLAPVSRRESEFNNV